MADKRRFLDVWIVESNTVYREVPYTVVTDWVQQGRLLDDDQLRPSGTPQWQRLGDIASFAAFLPKIEPQRVEDRAEALEPVQVDFAWKPRADDEDDDVDMIPLIDISLVLLIFFMMTAAVGGAGNIIETPQAQWTKLGLKADMLWVGVRPGPNGTQEYLIAEDDDKPSQPMSREQLLQAVEQKLNQRQGPVKINIRGHRQTPAESVFELTGLLQRYKKGGKIESIFTEVSEKVQ